MSSSQADVLIGFIIGIWILLIAIFAVLCGIFVSGRRNRG